MESEAHESQVQDGVQSPRSDKLFLGCFLVVLVTIVIGIGMAINAARVAYKSEENLHAAQCVIRVVEQFVYENGRWPDSWQELESVSLTGNDLSPMNAWVATLGPGQYNRFAWPRASKHLQACIEVDFKADTRQIVQQDCMEFDAIKPRGPYFEYRDYGFVASLQETLRQAQVGLPRNANPTAK
jgi:hypothetical protein